MRLRLLAGLVLVVLGAMPAFAAPHRHDWKLDSALQGRAQVLDATGGGDDQYSGWATSSGAGTSRTTPSALTTTSSVSRTSGKNKRPT